MRIAVNTRFLLKNKLEGFGWYTYETLSRITKQHPEHTFLFLFDRPYDPDYIFSENVIPVVIGPQARRPVLFRIWFEYSVKRALKKHRADVFVSPDGYLSLASDVPQLAVIHDLNFEYHPEDLPGWANRYLRKWFPRFAQKASRIVTVSHYSKKDLIKKYLIAPDKIDVVWNGAADFFRPVSDAKQKAVRAKLTGGFPFFIYIGALHPRKNIGRLLQAFERFRKKGGSPVKLLVAGESYWSDRDTQKIYRQMQFKSDVQFTGRLNADALAETLGSALALTYVSYFEGFGIPIAEAFACKVPVITSTLTALPEVAGNAALLVDPYSIDSISGALEKIATNEGLRHELAEAGYKRSTLFTWQKSADGLWNAIQKLSHG